MSAFHDYVRGISNDLPDGYNENGMRVYRYLVYLGVEQLLSAHFSTVRDALGEKDWRDLLQAFVRQSQWSSPYYGDLKDEFVTFLARESA